MQKQELLKDLYIKELDKKSEELEDISKKAYEFGDKDEYIKTQVKLGMIKMCKAFFKKTYGDIYEK